jgi:hypothetical protein
MVAVVGAAAVDDEGPEEDDVARLHGRIDGLVGVVGVVGQASLVVDRDVALLVAARDEAAV